MPIEIRELHIKAVIDAGGERPKTAQPGADMSQPTAETSSPQAEQLVDLCVEKVMEILKEKRER
ncbi:MAG: DUF5908 family protein [Bacteroidota bacterium]|nr:DUF5908 family protein [Bacteroidota bacterium]